MMGDVPKVVLCSKCQRSLLNHGEEGNEIVATPCGHVFHKTCVVEWCIAKCGGNGSGEPECSKKRKRHAVDCPKLECAELLSWYPSSNEITGLKHLFLDEGDDSRLESVYKELEKEREKLENENRQLAKRMITDEIKETLLLDKDRLEDKFGDLKWNDITPAFQMELLGKLKIRGRPVVNFDFLPINRKALVRLIKADENDETLIQKIIEDYFEEKKQSKPNGKVIWEDLDDSLRLYLISKLRETSKVESLELEQVPLSSNVLVHLITDNTENNIGYLGKIVTRHLDEMVKESLTEVKDLLKVALLKYINREVIGCVEVHFLKPQAMERLVEFGILRKAESEFDAPYEFVHDSVMHCIIGTLSKLMEQANVSRMNAFEVFHEGYMSPLGFYFTNYMIEEKESCMANFVLDEMDGDATLENLFMALSVMKLPSLKPVIAVLNHCSIDIRGIVLTRKVPQSQDLTLTMLHAAAIKGDLERVKCLLYDFGFSEVIFRSDPCTQNQGLMFACVENTIECSDDQIKQRKQIIEELIGWNRGLVTCDPPSPNLNVHDDLIKFMVEQEAFSWISLLATDDEQLNNLINY